MPALHAALLHESKIIQEKYIILAFVAMIWSHFCVISFDTWKRWPFKSARSFKIEMSSGSVYSTCEIIYVFLFAPRVIVLIDMYEYNYNNFIIWLCIENSHLSSLYFILSLIALIALFKRSCIVFPSGL